MFDYIPTKDGSFTLLSKEFNEHYHSLNTGALNESLEKHINPAFKFMLKQNKNEIHILDICFGLGYNVLACLLYLIKNKIDKKIIITSVEIDRELISQLSSFKYPPQLDEVFKKHKNIINNLAKTHSYKDEFLQINIICKDARESFYDFIKTQKKFDIIFQDPFSYKSTPLFWTFDYFKIIKNLMKDKSILTTFSKSTRVRLALHFNDLIICENMRDSKSIGTLCVLNHTNDIEVVDMDKKMALSNVKEPLFDRDFED